MGANEEIPGPNGWGFLRSGRRRSARDLGGNGGEGPAAGNQQ